MDYDNDNDTEKSFYSFLIGIILGLFIMFFVGGFSKNDVHNENIELKEKIQKLEFKIECYKETGSLKSFNFEEVK